MKKLITLAAMAVITATAGSAMAHGEKPKHGGVVAEGGDIHFELVGKDGKATLYVEDHGKPLATTGAIGKLTVLNGTEKSELPLEPAGENMMAAKGEARIGKGTKAIAAVTFANKKTVNVRFAIK